MELPNGFYYPGDEVPMPAGYYSPIFASPYALPAQSIRQGNRNSVGYNEERSNNHILNATSPVNTAPMDVEESMATTYRGDLRNPNNHSAPIPACMSTSVFISELPSSCSIHDVLNEIRDCGKIWASNLIPAQQNYATAAAKVVFWDRAGLDRFLQRWADGNFVVGGRLPKVVMNDYHSAPKCASPTSRVVRITGPRPIVNETYLRDFFRANFTFEVDEVIVMLDSPRPDINTVEFRFSSYRAQASAAWKWLQVACRGEPVQNVDMTMLGRFLWCGVRIEWGDDPCAF
ncbi:hypothetical protein F4775DRAFT_607095 [Biscogniauxia sp. FL1348]|nr:hypothetical protein F4775DRAFT_607095 [Biscogniauxia sp. FL1348]